MRPSLHLPRRSRRPMVTLWLVAAGVLAGSPAALAQVPWHADLAQAKAASQISRRPVLILFVATWSEASVAHDRTFLGTDESVALLTACFEPVRIDIDADKVTPSRYEVQHVPSACVVDTEERLLARFDCPESSAAFVAAAGRAAQDAAVACAGPLARPPVQPAAPLPGPVTGAAPGSSPAALPGPAPAPQAAADPAAPSLGPAPPAWPAEPAPGTVAPVAAPPAAAAAAPAGPIEPRPSASAAGAAPAAPPASGAPWLPPPPPAATSPEASQASAADPAGVEASAGAIAAGTESADKKPAGFWATVQKPFGSLLGKSPKPAEAAPAAAEMPATGTPGGEPGAPLPLGLEGYCAVTLVEKGQWVEGRAKWGVRHRGRTYLCAGPEEQRSFLANPDRFAPGLSGDDPVLAIDGGKRVGGQRQYGVSYRSRIYLFASPDTQAAFRVDPQKYAQRVQMAEQPTGATTLR